MEVIPKPILTQPLLDGMQQNSTLLMNLKIKKMVTLTKEKLLEVNGGSEHSEGVFYWISYWLHKVLDAMPEGYPAVGQ